MIDNSRTHQNEDKPEKPVPDPRLTNWEKWMQERQRINRSAAKKSQRHTEELLMNYAEDLRAINEEKTVFENAKIIYPHDRYRGNPAFWRLPVALQHKPCRPDYFSVMTNAQKCEIPKMEYVDVPDIIREEKGTLSTGYRNEKRVWDASKYRARRTQELDAKIQMAEPYKPQFRQLYVKGVGIANKPDTVVPSTPYLGTSEISTETVQSISLECITKQESEEYLMLNNYKLNNHTNTDVNIHLTFEYDMSADNLLSKSIQIINGTACALRYSLIPRKRFCLFRDIVQESDEQVFFYDKRERIITPNEKVDLKISFKTDFPSTYHLQLVMNVRPKLWEHTSVLHLVAVATYHNLSVKCAEMKEYIDSNARNDIVRHIIHEILEDIPSGGENSHLPTFYVYDKATIFDAVNQNFTPIVRHPKYVYNKEIIEELEEFYSKVRLPDSPATWNLNIEVLREMTKKKQDLIYRKKCIDEIITIKSTEEEKKNITGSSVVVKHRPSMLSKTPSTRSGKSSKSQMYLEEDSKAGENLVADLENILLKLQQFTMWINENKSLYESCYSVICTAFDIILQEIYQVEIDLNIPKNVKYPIGSSYNQHAFGDRIEEIHADLHGQPPRIKEDFIKQAKPIAECLKDIPLVETEARYKSYYGIADVVVTKKVKGKDKGKKEKPDKKTKKGKSKETLKQVKSKEKSLDKLEAMDVDFKENSKFNIDELPSTEALHPISSLKLSLSSEDESFSDTTSGLLLKEYKRALYNIFYRNLLEATVKLVDVIELHKHDKVRSANIKRMLEETSFNQPPVQIRVVDLKDAIRLAMDLPTKYQSTYADIYRTPQQPPAKFDDSVQIKELGSEWSILRPLKTPEAPAKPISHPEANIYLKKKISKRMLKDVGTIMSNAGIDPNWVDFKDVGVQMTSKWENRPEKEEFFSCILGNVVDEICMEEAAALISEEDGDTSELEDERLTSKSSEDIFYDDEIPDVPEKSTEKENIQNI